MANKLLFITPLFPKSKEDDTVVPFIAQFCEYFIEKQTDLEVHVVSINYPFIKAKYSYGKLIVFSLGNGFGNKLLFFPILIKNIFSIVKLFKQNRYEGVLSFWYGQSALLGIILNKIFKTPNYVWLQGQDVKKNNQYLKWVKTSSNKLILANREHQKVLEEQHNIKGSQIANIAVIPKRFPKLNTDTRAIDVIGVGNLGKLKNFSQFLNILFVVKKTHPNIQAVICGDGNERKKLEKIISQLGLEQNVKLLGYVSNQEVRNLMNNSKIMLHTSLFEGGCYAIQEALYSDCKVIYTYNSLGKNISNLFYIKDLTEISRKINSILESPYKDIERVIAYDIDQTVEKIYNLFFEANSKV